MIPRLKEKYKNEIIKNLMSKLNYKNAYGVPKIEKVVINMGLGDDASDQKNITLMMKKINLKKEILLK